MKTYKNKHYTTRDYECTNVIYCKAPTAPNDNWMEVTEEVPESMMQLWIEGSTRYYGFL